MSPLFEPYDPATPADVDQSGQGDDRIRELKRALTERLQRVWPNWPAGDPLTWTNGIIPSAAITFAAGGVPAASLPAKSVTQALIALLAVGTGELIDGAVTTSKIAAAAVGDGQLGAFPGSHVNDNSLAGTKLVDASIGSSKYALLSILAGAIADGAIETAKLAALAVTNAKIADATIEIAKLSATARGLISVTKSITMSVIGGNQGSDSHTEVGTAAFAGAAINDPIVVGLPNIAAWTAAERTNTWMPYVDAAGHVKLDVQNNTGGAKNWPGADIKLSITKTAAEWGL